MNIVCTKYGSTYDSEYVNHLYKMVKSNTTLDFNFWCQTEDATGIDSHINIIPITKVEPDKKRFHKISLLESKLLSGKCISFDLDIIINKNIDHYLNHQSKKLTLLFANFKDINEVIEKNKTRKIYKDMMLNSSIFSWNAGSKIVDEILNKHYTNKVDKHLGSFDRFLFWECPKLINVYKFNDYTAYYKDGLQKDKTFCIFNRVEKSTITKYWNSID